MNEQEELLRHADQQHLEALARLEHTVGYARSGLHAIMLANGGALIGLFTLIAPHRDLAGKLWPSGLSFSIGMVLALVSWMLATMSQDRFQPASTARAWNAEAKAAGRKPEEDEETDIGVGHCQMRLGYLSARYSSAGPPPAPTACRSYWNIR